MPKPRPASSPRPTPLLPSLPAPPGRKLSSAVPSSTPSAPRLPRRPSDSPASSPAPTGTTAESAPAPTDTAPIGPNASAR